MKKITLLAATVVASTMLFACGSKETSMSDSKDSLNLKLWVDPGSAEFYSKLVDQYKEENNIKYTIEVVESDTGKAQENIKKDPEAAADVFSMPHDQLGQLVEAGVVYENTKYADRISEENTELAVQAATYKGKMYGYPYGVESLMLYYDKTKLTENDIQTFETLTAKAKFGGNFEEDGAAYFLAPLFVSNDCYLYGEDGEDPSGTTFNTEQGVNVLKWIAAQGKNDNVVQANADLLSQLEEGKIAAVVSGPWGYKNIKEILGDRFAVAQYPKTNFGNGEKQMKPFLGVKLYSVNASTAHPLEAMALANFLSSTEAQKKTFNDLGTIPSNLSLQHSKEVLADPMASVVVTTSLPENSVLMPKIPEMVTFWPASLATISDAYKGNLSESDMKSKLDQLVKDTSVVAK
ncbi:sugar ABC transporter substrate-binding protein [Streptococcus cuniculi]|uniref:Sugar ABC transporter substrate-binding protein n=1 Tax=Streptococcus cuniculi TaxID=1432788 RepID=A0A1Q8E7H0_9STRE|nr:extracellular solute-binding protein [Streptococcus cuniculi]OLF47738.1 sugar ABC transporter substrate-binding protein [Streptococcus cuniculi]